MDYQKMIKYVEEKLTSSPYNRSNNPLHTFRNRFEHSIRVYQWGKKILPDFPNINEEIALTACIFHDIGYICDKNNHAHNSALEFLKYAEANNFSKEFTDRVYYTIDNHSNKNLLNDPNSPDELLLLLEADLLDEEGAMGIVWDLLAYGATHPDSYSSTLEVMSVHSGHILEQNYMVTPIARAIWEDKKAFVKKFIEEIEVDLFLKEKE